MVGAIGTSNAGKNFKGISSHHSSTNLKQPSLLKPTKDSNQTEATKKQTDPEIKQQIQQYITVENKVKAHEQAHKAVGGQYAGGISYNYKKGPDGKQYIVGGEVPIQAPEGKDPEDSIHILEQVRRAALAPADPSPQDLKVAANATQKMMEATEQLQRRPLGKKVGKASFAMMKQTYQSQQSLFFLMKKPQTIFDQAI